LQSDRESNIVTLYPKMVAAPLGVYDRSVVDAIGSEAVARLENLFNIYVTQQSAVHRARAILHFWDDQALRERHSAQRAARRRSGIRGGCVALLLCRILRTPSRVCEIARRGECAPAGYGAPVGICGVPRQWLTAVSYRAIEKPVALTWVAFS
jgi:hypothetical protein